MFNMRTFHLRGKPIQIKESTDIVAIKPGHGAAEATQRGGKNAAGRRARIAFEAMAPGVPQQDVRALENAGWRFVRSEEATQYGKGTVAAKVFVKPGGRLALGTDRLTVKLRGADDTKTAQTVLDKYGVRVLNALKFARGLYQVEIDATGTTKDALDVADELMNAGIVEFAEPEFVEVLGPR
jgi:hypothetical protein